MIGVDRIGGSMKKLIDRLGSLPGVATVLTGVVAVYIALVAFGNITDFDSNQAFVHHVLEMDTTFNDEDVMWRAIENDTLQNIGYVLVIAWETLAAVVTIWGTVLLLRARTTAQRLWGRKVATVGILMVMVLFGLGFISIGGEWFSMWQSSSWNGLDAAIRNFTLAGVTLILLHLPSKDWDAEAVPEVADEQRDVATP
jgi:predicted small integral membrane protein